MNTKKIILKSLAVLGIALVAFFLVIVALAFKYQNQAKAFVIEKVNQQLNTELLLDPQNIDFTVLSSFPLASVNIHKVALLDAIDASAKDKDTLLKAGTISFRFNISELLRKHYVLESIKVKDASLNIWVNKEGKDNFHFWKASADTVQASNVKDTTTFGLEQ